VFSTLHALGLSESCGMTGPLPRVFSDQSKKVDESNECRMDCSRFQFLSTACNHPISIFIKKHIQSLEGT